MFSYILSWYSVLSIIAICPIKQNLFSAKIYALHFFNASLVLWLPDVKNWLIEKDPDAGKYWRWEEKGTTEDEMVGWHHWLDVHEFEQASGVDDEQESLAYSSPWGCKKLDLTQWLNWTEVSDMASWVALVVKNLSANAGDPRKASSTPASGRSPGGGNSNSFQYSCLENSMDRGAWRATVHGVTKSQTCLSTHSI